MGSRKHLADHVEYGIIIKCIPDLLELLKQACRIRPSMVFVATKLKSNNPYAGRNDECVPFAVQACSGSMDIIIEKNIAALKVDTFTGCLCCDKYLDSPILNCCSA